MPPPSWCEALLDIVLFVTVSVPPLEMPPPESSEVFPDTMLSITVAEPLTERPPPSLSDTVLPLIVNVAPPLLLMAPSAELCGIR